MHAPGDLLIRAAPLFRPPTCAIGDQHDLRAIRHVCQPHETESALPDLPDELLLSTTVPCWMHNCPGVKCDSTEDASTVSVIRMLQLNEVGKAIRTSSRATSGALITDNRGWTRACIPVWTGLSIYTRLSHVYARRTGPVARRGL